jgi:hypothetical protein
VRRQARSLAAPRAMQGDPVRAGGLRRGAPTVRSGTLRPARGCTRRCDPQWRPLSASAELMVDPECRRARCAIRDTGLDPAVIAGPGECL